MQGCSSVGLRRGAAAWGCAGAQQGGAAQGCSSVGLLRGAAAWGCAGAQRRGATQSSCVGRRSGGGAVQGHSGMGVRWGAAGGRPGAAWGAWGACRGVVWGCGLLLSLSLRGCGEEDAGELRPESLGMGAGALAAGYPWLGWPGCPGVLWGRRLPTSAGCETTTCVSVTEVLRVLPQELTPRGDCGPGRPRAMTMKRKWGARMSLAVGTFPRPGGGRCPGLFPSSRGRGAVVGGGVATSQRVSVPGAVGTDPRWGRVRSARSPRPPCTTARQAPVGL